MWLACQFFNVCNGKTDDTTLLLLIASWPDLDRARQQAKRWVQNKLASSVNVLPQMDSTYVWNVELQHGKEHKVFINIHASNLDSLAKERLNLPIRMR